MAREDVRIDLPVNEPDGTIELVEKIIARNIALGINSPIADDFDFTGAAAAVASAKTLRKEADDADRLAQSQHNNCLTLLGTAKGQNRKTPGTIYSETLLIRDILMVKYNQTPEELELWGFDVVIDQIEGKRTVRIDIPSDSPENFITLAKAIATKNTDMGTASPLAGKIDMSAYKDKGIVAGEVFVTAETNRGIKEAKHGEALYILGYAPGQTSETPNTAYYFICQVRDLLLATYNTNPEELTLWGYKVVVSSSSHGGEKPTPPVP